MRKVLAGGRATGDSVRIDYIAVEGSHQLGNIVSHGRGRQFSSTIRVAVIKVCTEGVFEIEVRRQCVVSRIISPDQISGSPMNEYGPKSGPKC